MHCALEETVLADHQIDIFVEHFAGVQHGVSHHMHIVCLGDTQDGSGLVSVRRERTGPSGMLKCVCSRSGKFWLHSAVHTIF